MRSRTCLPFLLPTRKFRTDAHKTQKHKMLNWISEKLPFQKAGALQTPKAPILLHAGPDILCVSWREIPDANCYTVRRCLQSGETIANNSAITVDAKTSSSTFLLTGLSPGTSYSVQVYAMNTNTGSTSSWSSQGFFYTTNHAPKCPILSLPNRIDYISTALICCEAVYEDKKLVVSLLVYILLQMQDDPILPSLAFQKVHG